MPRSRFQTFLFGAVLLIAVPGLVGASTTAAASPPQHTGAANVATPAPSARDGPIVISNGPMDSSPLKRFAIRDAPADASPVIGTGWGALSFGTNNLTPPDIQVAVGPTRIVETVNLGLAVYTKLGQPLADYDLATFFGTGTDYLTDPQVQYDTLSDRWFVTITDGTPGQVLIAVSETGNPTAAWWFYAAPGSRTANCPDQPILAVGALNLIFSVNMYSNSCTSATYRYLGAEFWIVNKTDLITGAPSPSAWVSSRNVNDFSIHPVKMESPSSVEYMVATYWDTGSTSNMLQVFTVSGSPPGTVLVSEADLSMPTASVAPLASQLGSSYSLDPGDLRIADAAWSNGLLWLGFEEECPHPGYSPTACVRLVEVDPAASAILQSFDLSSTTRDYFYPALALDPLGDLAVAFGYSSGVDYPGVMATGRLTGDPTGVMQPPVIVWAGTGPETTWCPSSVCRYGDYFGANRDPSDPSTLWLAGEFGRGFAGWGTYIFSLRLKAMLTMSYGVNGIDLPATGPTLHYTLDGVAVAAVLATVPTTVLADPGTPWRIDANLTSPSSQTRYILRPSDTNRLSGMSDRSTSVSITYQEQFLVVVRTNTPLVASLVIGGGWYDSGAGATVAASGNTTWRFSGWTGSGNGAYTGSGGLAALTVLGPITEVASFDPSLTISAGSGGDVVYSTGTTTDTVPSGQSRTVFIPFGSAVSLSARPSSLVWTFSRWTGDVPSGPSSASITVDRPAEVGAVFEPNWIFVAGAPATISVAAILVAALLRYRKRKSTSPRSVPPAAPPPPSGGSNP